MGLIILAGCGDSRQTSNEPASTDPPMPVAPATPPEGISASALRAQLKANDNARFLREGGRITQIDLHESGAVTLEPLRGMPLTALGISGLPIDDLAPLEGLPLELLTAEDTPVENLGPLAKSPLRELYLRNSQVRSLEPIRGCPLEQLNIVGTPVTDLGPLRDMPLQTLWIASTPVDDLSPLAGKTLVSLDLENTAVVDLAVVSTMKSLRRLNIAGTQITDLTPIADLPLERLIFTPSKIDRGIEAIRAMPTLQTLGVDFDHLQPADEFWSAYDAAGQATPAESVNPE